MPRKAEVAPEGYQSLLRHWVNKWLEQARRDHEHVL